MQMYRLATGLIAIHGSRMLQSVTVLRQFINHHHQQKFDDGKLQQLDLFRGRLLPGPGYPSLHHSRIRVLKGAQIPPARGGLPLAPAIRPNLILQHTPYQNPGGTGEVRA